MSNVKNKLCACVYILNCHFNYILITCNYLLLYLFPLLSVSVSLFSVCIHVLLKCFPCVGTKINISTFVCLCIFFVSLKKHTKEFKVLSQFVSLSFGKYHNAQIKAIPRFTHQSWRMPSAVCQLSLTEYRSNLLFIVWFL